MRGAARREQAGGVVHAEARIAEAAKGKSSRKTVSTGVGIGGGGANDRCGCALILQSVGNRQRICNERLAGSIEWLVFVGFQDGQDFLCVSHQFLSR